MLEWDEDQEDEGDDEDEDEADDEEEAERRLAFFDGHNPSGWCHECEDWPCHVYEVV